MLTVIDPTGLLILGLTREDMTSLFTTPLGFSGPPTEVQDVLIVYGETSTDLIAALTEMGLDLPDDLKDFALSIAPSRPTVQ